MQDENFFQMIPALKIHLQIYIDFVSKLAVLVVKVDLFLESNWNMHFNLYCDPWGQVIFSSEKIKVKQF